MALPSPVARRTRGESEIAVRPDGAAEDGIGLNRPVVLQAHLQPVVVLELRGGLHEQLIAPALNGSCALLNVWLVWTRRYAAKNHSRFPGDRTAEREVWLVVLWLVPRNPLDVRIVERLRYEKEGRRAVERVPAALGDDVHVLTDHAGAVGGFRTERLHFDVLNGVVIQD